MKKVLAILLAISVLALSACAAKQVNSDTQKDSNTAETEQKPGSEQTEQPAQEAKRVEPMPESLDLNALTDATVAVSFGADDISETNGKTELTLTVYDYDLYDMVDIAQRAPLILFVVVDKHADDPRVVLCQEDPRHVGDILPLLQQRRHALDRRVRDLLRLPVDHVRYRRRAEPQFLRQITLRALLKIYLPNQVSLIVRKKRQRLM